MLASTAWASPSRELTVDREPRMWLRYGINPDRSADLSAVTPERSPLRVVQGAASYVNILDALNAWQLVRDARTAFDRPVAASFKHVSPAGAAIAGPLDDVMADTYRLDPSSTGSLTAAYARARDADPRASYGCSPVASTPPAVTSSTNGSMYSSSYSSSMPTLSPPACSVSTSATRTARSASSR